jgi:hypothetical protein
VARRGRVSYSSIGLGRWGTGEEIAKCAYYVCLGSQAILAGAAVSQFDLTVTFNIAFIK